jgi:hypothetical protein
MSGLWAGSGLPDVLFLGGKQQIAFDGGVAWVVVPVPTASPGGLAALSQPS